MTSIQHHHHHHHHHRDKRKQKLKKIGSAFLIVVAALFFIFIIFAVFAPENIDDIRDHLEDLTQKEKPKPSRQAMLDYDGIDVSHHQKIIDWERVAADTCVKFVYIKATEGSTYIDSLYDINIMGARSCGIPAGSYHYLTSASAIKSQFANFSSKAVAEMQDLLPMIDVEEEGVKGWSREQLQDSLALFVKLCENYYGKAPLIYSYSKFYNQYLAPTFNKYHLFIAKYSPSEPVVDGAGEHNLWQHNDQGIVDGIPTSVDLDMFAPTTTLQDILLK